MVTGTGAECPIVPYGLCSGPSSLGAVGFWSVSVGYQVSLVTCMLVHHQSLEPGETRETLLPPPLVPQG